MRLVLDLQACQGPSADRGIGYYALSLAHALHRARGQDELVVLLDGAAPTPDLLALRHRLTEVLPHDQVRLFPGLGWERREAAPRAARAAREAALAALQPDAVLISSVFELEPGAPMSVGEWAPGLPTAAVLYDLIPLQDLSLYKPDPRLRAEYVAGLETLRRTGLLLSISDHSAREARRLLDGCPRTVTVHGAPPAPARARRSPAVQRPGFGLAVGRAEPRKDVRTAVLAWAALAPEVRRGRPFVVAGLWPDDDRRRLQELAVAHGLPRADLVFAGAVDDEELAWLYQQASVFCFPSTEEGLGLPPLEAMAAGTPCLLARSSSLVELVDDDAAYFPTGDVVALTAALSAVLQDDDVRERLLAAGRRAVQRFTWERTAGTSWQALRELAREQQASRPVGLGVSVTEPDRPALATAATAVGSAALSLPDPADDGGAAGCPSPASGGVVGHVLGGAESWALAEEGLLRAPGPVLVLDVPDDDVDVRLVLAAAPGVVACTTDVATALLRKGWTGPVEVLDRPVEQHLLEAHRADVRTWYAEATASTVVEDDSHVLDPPLASTSRGPLVVAADVTVYRRTPFFSGIQRATRHVHDALSPLVQATGGAILPTLLGDSPPEPVHPDIAEDRVLAAHLMEVEQADWLLGVDLNALLRDQVDRIDRARARGTRTALYVHDLLPHFRPEWWPPGSAEVSFRPWVRAVTRTGDVLLVNSLATAADLERFVRAEPPRRRDGFEVHLLRLGADFPGPVPRDEARQPDHFLMVGTVEPRKGHRAVLDALQALWAAGETPRLTVVGREGWLVDELAQRMTALSARQPLFRWLQQASDQELDGLYRTCTATIVASEGEGFGLPVVEAAVRECPVVVRDIPVLREVAGDQAVYFRPDGSDLREVLCAVAGGGALPRIDVDRLVTWEEVGARLLRILQERETPLARWTSRGGWAWTSAEQHAEPSRG